MILGLAEAAAEAVSCLRAGLAEPSFVAPFIDPYLPHYDSVRDSEPFQTLLSDLGGAAAGVVPGQRR